LPGKMLHPLSRTHSTIQIGFLVFDNEYMIKIPSTKNSLSKRWLKLYLMHFRQSTYSNNIYISFYSTKKKKSWG
jgi:hypothetical protein